MSRENPEVGRIDDPEKAEEMARASNDQRSAAAELRKKGSILMNGEWISGEDISDKRPLHFFNEAGIFDRRAEEIETLTALAYDTIKRAGKLSDDELRREREKADEDEKLTFEENHRAFEEKTIVEEKARRNIIAMEQRIKTTGLAHIRSVVRQRGIYSVFRERFSKEDKK